MKRNQRFGCGRQVENNDFSNVLKKNNHNHSETESNKIIPKQNNPRSLFRLDERKKENCRYYSCENVQV